jgi:hypothetical protein
MASQTEYGVPKSKQVACPLSSRAAVPLGIGLPERGASDGAQRVYDQL